MDICGPSNFKHIESTCAVINQIRVPSHVLHLGIKAFGRQTFLWVAQSFENSCFEYPKSHFL